MLRGWQAHVRRDDSDFAEIGAAFGAGEGSDPADAVAAVAADRVGTHGCMVTHLGRDVRDAADRDMSQLEMRIPQIAKALLNKNRHF